jgi:hypothetical protein
VGSKEELRTYDPTRVPDLYRKFLEIGTDSNLALGFAQKYGMGGVVFERPDARGEGEYWLPLSLLFYDVWRLQLVYDLCLALERRDWHFIRSQRARAEAAIALGTSRVPIVSADPAAEVGPCATIPDLEEAACCLLTHLMTQNLGSPGVSVIAQYVPEQGFALVSRVQGLLAALSARMYEAIQGSKGYGQCPECQTWFLKEKRRDQTYCSTTCGDRVRQRLRQERKRRAVADREMHPGRAL